MPAMADTAALDWCCSCRTWGKKGLGLRSLPPPPSPESEREPRVVAPRRD